MGAGFGSLTVAIAKTGADVTAVEFDRALVPALEEVLAPHPNVRLVVGDAMRMDWTELLGAHGWRMVSNLPYNVSVPLVFDLLEHAPQIDAFLVMVQREVGDRLSAGPGDEAYGAVSVRIAFRADASLVRRVPSSVFWPKPNVGSAVVRIVPRSAPTDVDEHVLFRVVEVAFAERRKTMNNALRRLGLAAGEATRLLIASGVEPSMRPESLGLDRFVAVAETLVREGILP